jgi:hypothetical protein
MVNYLYDLAEVEDNYEAFVQRGIIVTGKPLQQLAQSFGIAFREAAHA